MDRFTIALKRSQHTTRGQDAIDRECRLCLISNFVKSELALALMAFASMFINVSVCTIDVSVCIIDVSYVPLNATRSSLVGVIPVLYSRIAWTCTAFVNSSYGQCMASDAPCTAPSSSRVLRWMRVIIWWVKGMLNRVPPQSLGFLWRLRAG